MTDSQHNFDGLASLIAFTGFTVPARARFVAQFIGSSLYSSITCGLVAGQAGAMVSCGPLIPFMAGSWFGYTWGAIGFWKQSQKKAISCARRYPRILAHSIQTGFDMEVPTSVIENSEKEQTEVSGQSLEEWILSGGIRRLSYAVLAVQSCDEDIAELQKNERQKLIDGYSEKDVE